MSLSPAPQQPPQRRRGDYATNATAILITVIRFFTTLVDRFGWRGGFVCDRGSDTIMGDPRPETTDYRHVRPWQGHAFVVAARRAVDLFILLFWAQRLINRKEVRKIKGEMKRIGKKKSELQEKLTGKELRHRKDDADL